MKLLSVPSALIFVTLCAGSPTPRADVVFKPTFLTGYDSLTAGTGFIARIGGETVFLTAHHLFGPAAGLERDLSPAEAKDYARALAATSMNQRSVVLTSTEMLLIPTAKAFEKRDAGHDVAAFVLRGYRGEQLPIATAAPKKGDRAYLLARPRGEETLRLVPAVIGRVEKGWIDYFYDEPGVNFAGTSGAPLLNEAGEVICINLGGGEVSGRTYGFGNPAASFGDLVASAIKGNQPSTPTRGNGT